MNAKTWRADLVLIALLLLTLVKTNGALPNRWFNIAVWTVTGLSILWLGWVLWRRPNGWTSVVTAGITLLLVVLYIGIHIAAQNVPVYEQATPYFNWTIAYLAYILIRGVVFDIQARAAREK